MRLEITLAFTCTLLLCDVASAGSRLHPRSGRRAALKRQTARRSLDARAGRLDHARARVDKLRDIVTVYTAGPHGSAGMLGAVSGKLGLAVERVTPRKGPEEFRLGVNAGVGAGIGAGRTLHLGSVARYPRKPRQNRWRRVLRSLFDASGGAVAEGALGVGGAATLPEKDAGGIYSMNGDGRGTYVGGPSVGAGVMAGLTVGSFRLQLPIALRVNTRRTRERTRLQGEAQKLLGQLDGTINRWNRNPPETLGRTFERRLQRLEEVSARLVSLQPQPLAPVKSAKSLLNKARSLLYHRGDGARGHR